MSKDPTGGPAFPHGPLGDTMRGEDGREWHQCPAGTGMTMRDYAIVQFMAALIAKDEFDWESGKLKCDHGSCVPIIIAAEQADAMLAEREKGAK